MIELNQQLCEELDLTYWQLSNAAELACVSHVISREEKELLRKILLAKGIVLSDNDTEIQEGGVVIVNVNGHQMIFDNVSKQDTANTTHLAMLTEMLNSDEKKKHTWYKLKNLSI